MQDKLIEAAQHVVDEMERGYPILGPVCRLKEALATVRAHDAGKVSTAQNGVDAGEFFVTENRLKEVLASFHAALSALCQQQNEALGRSLLAIDAFWPNDPPENEGQASEDRAINEVRKRLRASITAYAALFPKTGGAK